MDKKGNVCGTFTQVFTDLPVNASPPSVTASVHVADKLRDYDSTSGTGDSSFIIYIGGACNGAIFDSSGATVVASGTSHFNVSNDGNRSDFIITRLTNPINSIGGFSASAMELKQTVPES